VLRPDSRAVALTDELKLLEPELVGLETIVLDVRVVEVAVVIGTVVVAVCEGIEGEYSSSPPLSRINR
jgi:hypothetical protein